MRSTIARGLYVAKGIPKPPAVNMRKMVGANTAQQVADNCVFAHSNRAGRNIGENLYQYKIQTGIDACKAWEVEFEKFGWPSNLLTESSFQTGIGHATQMGWWKSSMIGCGVAQCFDNNYQKLLVVCHYRDTGNWINENMYNSGATCSSCGEGYSCETSSGLCTV
ncbi:unnamed protein product [Heligmosomoides polygyrus]|uniref:SCP domain-containing protein n=1 Tax=Heligmosomoides polygyrus TaxID=6339 RepID=A0A183G919_HELPZ|nr:unnamed protein product [Heligmosomoides polygyrus]